MQFLKINLFSNARTKKFYKNIDNYGCFQIAKQTVVVNTENVLLTFKLTTDYLKTKHSLCQGINYTKIKHHEISNGIEVTIM
jgi:hypothetical protein